MLVLRAFVSTHAIALATLTALLLLVLCGHALELALASLTASEAASAAD